MRRRFFRDRKISAALPRTDVRSVSWWYNNLFNKLGIVSVALALGFLTQALVQGGGVTPAQGSSLHDASIRSQNAISTQMPDGFTVSDLSVSPDSVAAGNPVTARVTVTNSGTLEGDYETTLSVDGQTVATIEGSLQQLGSKIHETSIYRSKPGIYFIGVEDLVESLIIPGPQIILNELRVFPQILGPSTPVDIYFEVANQGGFPGNYEIPVFVGGTLIGTHMGNLPSGMSKQLTFTHMTEIPGMYSVNVGNLVSYFTVMDPTVVSLPDDPFIAPDVAQAVDDQYISLKLTGDQIIQADTAEFAIFDFPVALEQRKSLREFHDPATGIKVVNGQIIIPMLDGALQEVARVVGEVESADGTGTTARILVRKDTLKLVVQEQHTDFSAYDARLGLVTVSAEAWLGNLTKAAQVKMTTKMAPLAELETELQVGAGGESYTIVKNGFVVDFVPENSADWDDLGPIAVTLKFDRAWAESQPGIPDDLRIVLLEGDSDSGILQTTCASPDDAGRYACNAILPNGWAQLSMVSVMPTSSQVVYTDIQLSSPVAEPGEVVEVTLSITNKGNDLTWATPILQINGKPNSAMTVMLKGGETREVSFLTELNTNGSHLFEIGRHESYLEVAPTLSTALLEVEDIQVYPGTILLGQEASISLTVRNVGEKEGKFDIPLEINGVVWDIQPIYLTVGESLPVTFSIIPEQDGDYAVNVLGVTETFKAKEITSGPAFEVTELRVESKRWVLPDTPVTVTALVSNKGDEIGLFTTNLMVNGNVAEIRKVAISRLSSVPISFQMTRTTPGLYKLEVEGQKAEFGVSYVNPTKLLVSLQPLKPTLPVGEVVRIIATVNNLDALDADQKIEFKINGELIESRRVTLGSNAGRNEEFLFTPSQTGMYEIDIAGAAARIESVDRSGGIPGIVVLLLTVLGVILVGGFVVWLVWLRSQRLPGTASG